MGLAIDGNLVHGIARGGQAFVSIGNTNADRSINIGGQDYLSKNWMRIKDTKHFGLNLSSDALSGTIDVTDNLSKYGGYLAICVIGTLDIDTPVSTLSQPIVIPTSSTEDLSFTDSSWSGSLSATLDSKLTFEVSCSNSAYLAAATGDFYILSNN